MHLHEKDIKESNNNLKSIEMLSINKKKITKNNKNKGVSLKKIWLQ